MPLCTAALGDMQDLPCDNSLCVEIVLLQLLKDVKHLIQRIEEHVQLVAGSLEVDGSTHLAFICWHQIGSLSVEAPLKDHIESENKSQTS